MFKKPSHIFFLSPKFTFKLALPGVQKKTKFFQTVQCDPQKSIQVDLSKSEWNFKCSINTTMKLPGYTNIVFPLAEDENPKSISNQCVNSKHRQMLHVTVISHNYFL
jgi:hypothetical protein